MTDEEKKAKGASKKAEFLAWQKAQKAAWTAQVEQHFGYLQRDYNMSITGIELSAWHTRVIYRSPTTVVYVDRSVEFNRVELSVVQVVGNTIPPYPIFFSPQAPYHQTLLDNVLQVRAPEAHAAITSYRGLSDEEIERALVFWANALRSYSEDLLRGDFAAFEDEKALIAEWVRHRPQVITVYTAADAPPERGHALAKEVDPGIPEVTVQVRRYSRSPRKKRTTQAITPETGPEQV